jgi:predicted nucleic-acid-binding protein
MKRTKITVDTNVLIRAVMHDDAAQAKIATKALTNAGLIAVTLPCLCEFVWVLLRVYKLKPSDAATAIRTLMAASNVELNKPAVEFGLSILEAGGDFADGVISHEGIWLGGETFVSFDKKAVSLVADQGHLARLL